MNFYIGDTFRDALERLDAQSIALAKQAAIDIQLNPVSTSGQMHRIDKAKDDNWWSYRVNRDVRLIVHQQHDAMTLCYVDHHDPAYAWAQRRKFQVHPQTGAAQIVEIEERIEEVVKRVTREVLDEPPVFEKCDRDYLLALGVPLEWLDAVLLVTESGLDGLKGHLPEEAFERLYAIACGIPVPRPATVVGGNPFLHPDARRRFQPFASEDELRNALEAPWERWRLFLHPVQREVVERNYKGSARVSGGAGTGKTVVALHRARALADRDPNARILLTTFSKTLAARLAQSADLLIGVGTPARKQIAITNLHRFANEHWKTECGGLFSPVSKKRLQQMIRDARAASGATTYTLGFLQAEWDSIVDNFGITTWDVYRSVSRVGRGMALGLKQRKELWSVFERVRKSMADAGVMTWNDLLVTVRQAVERATERLFEHVIVDESQDFGPCELALVRALVAPGPNDILLCGDVGQRIFKGRTSWLQTGIDIRGRSTQLRVNYRTTEQIREFADQLLPESIVDGEGASEDRRTISLLRGPNPEVKGYPSQTAERTGIVEWIARVQAAGIEPEQIALFGRSSAIVDSRISKAVSAASMKFQKLSDEEPIDVGSVCIGTMHKAKGLEFKAVAVVGCDSDVLPIKMALDEIEDAVDRATFEEGERQLLYVACTRAREHLLVTHVGEPSRYLAKG